MIKNCGDRVRSKKSQVRRSKPHLKVITADNIHNVDITFTVALWFIYLQSHCNDHTHHVQLLTSGANVDDLADGNEDDTVSFTAYTSHDLYTIPLMSSVTTTRNIVLHYFCKIAFKTKSIISTGLHKVQHLIYFYLHSFLTFKANPDKHSISAISLTLDALTFYSCILQ